MKAAWLLVVVASCRPSYDPGRLPRTEPVIGWTLLRSMPHDASSFTQGLAYADGYLYESAGGERTSRVMKIDARTGKIVDERAWPGAIEGTTAPPFAEGLAIADGMLVQLSWKNERALTWSRALQRGHDLPYDGEGWGLCFDGQGYWRSDGGARLRRHVGAAFIELPASAVTVRSRGVEVDDLNELECIGDHVYANVWHTPYVAVIRARDGVVVGALDFSSLVRDVGASGPESVLNGLAWDADARELYVTGKRWAKLYVVRVDP